MSISRRHDTQHGWREAFYSDCERYRFRLDVVWDSDAPRLTIVMLNPSKATELANDPTIERCEKRAHRLGFGAMRIVNLFALRETSPRRLKASAAPDRPENDLHIIEAAMWADTTLAAWGVHGAHAERDRHVLRGLRGTEKPLFSLGFTKHGQPRHPLYVPYAQPFICWQ